jgi:hypothetical protein
MKVLAKFLAVVALLALAASLRAAPVVTVPKGTAVTLVFDQPLSSKTAKAGDTVRLHVKDNVEIGPITVISAGTPVTGLLTEVKHRQRFGINGKILIGLNPVSSTYGKMIPLNPRQSGQQFGGKKSEQAAGTAVGGAILLGPVGLVGGYFVSGRQVVIKTGDLLPTEVAKDTTLRHRRR